MILTFGLYSAFLAFSAILLRSSLQHMFTVETTFLGKYEILEPEFVGTGFWVGLVKEFLEVAFVANED